ncbi:MAG: CBS domain-containing protein [Phycisphaeraceae bacterium]|nr:CBS domain-containing protein [Phycisphaeraceae bacterium]
MIGRMHRRERERAVPPKHVGEVMTHDPICIRPSASIRELAGMLEEHEISGVPVVDQQGKLIGIVGKTDLVRRCTQGLEELAPAYLFEVLAEQGADEDGRGANGPIPEPLIRVEDFMNDAPATARAGTPIAEVARRMADGGIHRVVVIDEQRFPVGIVTSLDLVKLLRDARG